MHELITYKVQIMTSASSISQKMVVVGGITYEAEKYYHNGVYCLAIGRFESGSTASGLADKCRKSDFPGAFVVAFKNSERMD
jgi:hypothetical protein